MVHEVLAQAMVASEAARIRQILVVDDEEDIRDAIKALLERSIPGVRVLTAESGPAGLVLLRQEHIDLIVTDYKMPQMNGVEFLAEARKVAPRAPRIMITAFERELAEELEEQEAASYVFTKPLNPRPLVSTCNRILATQ